MAMGSGPAKFLQPQGRMAKILKQQAQLVVDSLPDLEGQSPVVSEKNVCPLLPIPLVPAPLGKEGAVPPFIPDIAARLTFKAAIYQSGSPGQVGFEIIRCDGLPRLDSDGGK